MIRKKRGKNFPKIAINDTRINVEYEKQGFFQRLLKFEKKYIGSYGQITFKIERKEYNKIIKMYNNPDIETFKIVPVLSTKRGERK